MTEEAPVEAELESVPVSVSEAMAEVARLTESLRLAMVAIDQQRLVIEELRAALQESIDADCLPGLEHCSVPWHVRARTALSHIP